MTENNDNNIDMQKENIQPADVLAHLQLLHGELRINKQYTDKIIRAFRSAVGILIFLEVTIILLHILELLT